MAEDSGSDGAPKNGLKKTSDAWIFVSHSHMDLQAVRRVRDELERLHANPLLFFLMCLDENEELDSLIKREIRARNFFLLCDSPFARASPWVQKERKFVSALVESPPDDRKRKVHELNLDWLWERQRSVIHEALRAATAFISHSVRDRDRVRPYVDLLVANDLAVFEPLAEMLGRSWRDQLDTAIARSATGYFFAFLSQDWLRSAGARREIERYLALTDSLGTGGRPILVALDPISSLGLVNLPKELRDMQILDFSNGNAAENGRKLLVAVELRQPTHNRRGQA
jgi:hypothetical protein